MSGIKARLWTCLSGCLHEGPPPFHRRTFDLGRGSEGQPDWKAFWPWHLPSSPLLCHHFDARSAQWQPASRATLPHGGREVRLAAGKWEKHEQGRERERRETARPVLINKPPFYKPRSCVLRQSHESACCVFHLNVWLGDSCLPESEGY